MSIDVALTHRTNYRYERPITLHPQVVRLRPAPHTRTPILSYALHIGPDEHFINWQQDPFANWQARLVFPETVTEFSVEVDLIARMVAINPFDFFLEEAASEVPFTYAKELKADLAPYLVPAPADPVLRDFVASAPQPKGMTTNDFMVALNQFVEGEVGYIVRMEPGVQTPAETIVKAKGSCRDSGWLLVQMLRQHGFAARFVSGYLIQLAPDQKAVDGPSGPEADFTDLHAWAEVYLPGAGWVGLDPTSGLFAGEGHIPLAATPAPQSAAPISGSHEPAEVEFGFEMKVERVRETPRVTAPIPDTAWSDVMAAGRAVDARLTAGDVRLTVGGEPTFISAYDRDAEEWTVGAVGPTKRGFADKLIRRLRDRFAPGGMLHYGQGKWYPGEQLPRWAFALYWRTDGVPFWRDQALIAPEGAAEATPEDAERFMGGLCEALGVEAGFAAPAFEDPAEFLLREQNLAPNVDPVNNRLEEPEERERLARVFDRGLGVPAAWVLPLQLAQAKASGARRFRWMSERWRTRRGRLFLIPGDSPAGFRLPLKALAWLPEAFQPQIYQRDPFAVPRPLPRFQSTGAQMGPAGLPRLSPGVGGGAGNLAEDWFDETLDWSPALWDQPDLPGADAAIGAYFLGPAPAVRTALTVEARAGRLTVFLPPTGSADEYADLVA
ncbi:MAG: transglutaminase family protein, partial [Pseudomonadota bacterium]